MTPIYEVETVHTRKVLEDFIKFTYKIKYPRVTIHLLVLSAGFFAIAVMAGGGIGTYICILLGAPLAVIALFRKKIGLSKLMKADENYQKQSQIKFIFGESEFRVENEDVGQKERIKYAEITYMYADDNYYYLGINGQEIQLIPKADFSKGDPTEFYDFISNKTGKPVRPMYIPWKVRFRMMMEYRDARAEARAEEAEKKKREKKKNKK